MKNILFFVLMLVLAACNNEDVVKLKEKPEGLYAHYNISADDEHNAATCLVRYYTDKSEKKAVVLTGPSKVELDEITMPMDSTGFMGAFYEMQLPLSDFMRQHTITYVSNEQRYKENFSFTPVKLVSDLSIPVHKNGFILELEGLKPEDEVRLVMMDTAFENDGINQLETVKDGQLKISSEMLQTLKSGPVILEISKETEKPLASGITGILTTSYTLRRSLELRD